jgi:DNA-directed RNA polymerase subunit F
LVSNSAPKSEKSPELTFDEKTAFEWFQKFTFFVESELVGRIVGISRDRTGELLREFRHES